MKITTESLATFGEDLRAEYQRGYDETPTWHDLVSMVFTSTQGFEVYGWSTDPNPPVPPLREWLGERVVHNFAPFARDATIAYNEHYELTMSVRRTDIEDETVDPRPYFREMGKAVKLHPGQLIADLAQRGHTSDARSCDGYPFFSAQRRNVNLFLSLPLDVLAYLKVCDQMDGFVGDTGNALGVRPSVLLLPPQLRKTGKVVRKAVVALNRAQRRIRIDAKQYPVPEILVAAELAADPATWYALDTTRAVKPFVHQLRQPPRFLPMFDPAHPKSVALREYVFGVDTRDAPTFSTPSLAVKATARASL